MDTANPKPALASRNSEATAFAQDSKSTECKGSEISIREFLDFLKIAYQINDSVENVLLANGLNSSVDWIKLKETNLAKPREIACQTSETKLRDINHKNPDDFTLVGDHRDDVKRKLSEVLSEGVMDSVLSFIIPSNTSVISRHSSHNKLVDKMSNLSVNSNDKLITRRRKSCDISSISSKSISAKSDCEIIIHVCDEVKNLKRDFTCNQNLLIEKMGYFAEITNGNLEDMDISIYCDIGIFEWLIRWVKKDLPDEEGVLDLDPQCVVPILVSAAFLQMDPLLQECLLYCHRHMNDILKTSTNLSCLNDPVTTRLAAMYTNTEVEVIRDRKDKIQSRLFCKLIQSLCEPDPESMRGHWSSLARAFRCDHCQQLVTPSVGPEIPCVPSNMRLLCDGSVIHHHERDASWNINNYIEILFKSFKTWRKVYWRLWGDAHFLYCTICKKYFPVNQIAWCRYHPDPPQYFTVDAQRAPLPVGRFPCCGERAYRFQLLEPESGCQFREHMPCTEDVRDAAVLTLLENHRSVIEVEAPKLMFPERLTRLVAKAPTGEEKDSSEGKSPNNHHFWWKGLVLIPPRPKLGLLGSFEADTKAVQQFNEPICLSNEAAEEEDYYTDYSDASSGADSSFHSEGKSDESFHPPTPKNKKDRQRKRMHRFWQQNLSARSNQDIQRAHEESAIKSMGSVLGRRTLFNMDHSTTKLSSKTFSRHITPPGGVWVRLENDWRERNYLAQSMKPKHLLGGKPSKVKTGRIA